MVLMVFLINETSRKAYFTQTRSGASATGRYGGRRRPTRSDPTRRAEDSARTGTPFPPRRRDDPAAREGGFGIYDPIPEPHPAHSRTASGRASPHRLCALHGRLDVGETGTIGKAQSGCDRGRQR